MPVEPVHAGRRVALYEILRSLHGSVDVKKLERWPKNWGR
jgi:hypothetical protein